MSTAQVAISGIGVATSLGCTASQACAAARAGLARATDVGMTVENGEGDETLVIGHPIVGLTDGFSGVGRYARMCIEALENLLGPGNGTSVEPSSTGFYLHVSDHYLYRAHAAAEEYGEEMRSHEHILHTEWEGQAAFIQAIQEKLLPIMAERHGLNPSAMMLHYGSVPAFVNTLELAGAALARGEFDRVLVGAVDSLVETSMLEAMWDLGVLRTPETPFGIMPGECASFLLLESVSRATERVGEPHVVLDGLARCGGTSHRFSEEPPTGAELANCVSETFRQGNPGEVGICIGNLNGEDHRAREYGGMLPRINAANLPVDFGLWCPAISFGETGAATAALSICLGVRALERGYAKGDTILVVLLSDDADRASFLIRRADA